MSDNEQNLLAMYRALHDWLSEAIEDDDTIDLAALADKLEDIARLDNIVRDEEDQ